MAIGLGLTFDEFGMWLHLGGLYWQRASFDAVTVISAMLALVAYGSTIRHWPAAPLDHRGAGHRDFHFRLCAVFIRAEVRKSRGDVSGATRGERTVVSGCGDFVAGEHTATRLVVP